MYPRSPQTKFVAHLIQEDGDVASVCDNITLTFHFCSVLQEDLTSLLFVLWNGQ